jgi:hypothetical protein
VGGAGNEAQWEAGENCPDRDALQRRNKKKKNSGVGGRENHPTRDFSSRGNKEGGRRVGGCRAQGVAL